MAASKRKVALVTGSSGLIGSEVVDYFMRAEFFGAEGDTRWNQRRLLATHKGFHHHELDIRDRAGADALVAAVKPALAVHAAAQPSHDLAASRPLDDFDVNAVGTLNMLEAVRRHAIEC